MERKELSRELPDESRRDFGRGVAATIAGVTLAPSSLIFAPGALADEVTPLDPQDQGADLSAEAKAEVDSKMQNIIARWGDRLSDEQKTRLRATVTRHVRTLEVVRKFPLENGDAPAPVLRVLPEGGPAGHEMRGAGREAPAKSEGNGGN